MISLNFYQVCEELIGLNAGQSFHDNYSGILIRPITDNSPGYTQYEELRKGRFAFLKNAWDSLSSIELATFTAVAGTDNAALRLFLNANINLILSENSMISSYPGTSSPASFPVSITSITNESFFIKASSFTTIVPADHSLLILATACKSPSKIFTDPPQYSPIVSFPAGTDLTADTDIINDWKSYFGETTLGKRICIKAVLIDITNGTRGSASFSCQDVTAVVIPFYQGLNFRQTASYVIDPPGSTYILGNSQMYPYVTPQGNTVGYTAANSQRLQRGSTTPPELAGSNYNFSFNPNSVFRIDLPQSGTYNIRLGIGDIYAHLVSLRLYDDATLFASLSYPSLPGDMFMDAAGNIWSRAAWSANNVPISYNFTSQILLIEWGPIPAAADNCLISTVTVYN